LERRVNSGVSMNWMELGLKPIMTPQVKTIRE
jgi:hypothetical protein